MRLILLRHGETVENSMGIIQGHLPGKLNEAGIKQAYEAGKILNTEKIDVIYSSDLRRTVETTTEVQKFFENVPVFYTKELREIDMGVNQGKSKNELKWKVDFDGNYTPPENGESAEQLYGRVDKFLDFLLEKHIDETVLCVSHNATIKAFLAIFKGVQKTKLFSIENIHNTSISIICLKNKNDFEIILFNANKL